MSALSSLKPVGNPTLRGQAVDRVKGLIISGKLPAGERLTETELSEALGISRGPLREAIRDLVELGLLVSEPYKGLFVRTVTRKDLEEIYSLRTALEKLAFQQCWDRRTPDTIIDLQGRNSALIEVIDGNPDPFGAIERELDLHSWCYELSDHKLLMRSWQRLRPNLQFYFVMHQQAHGRSGPLREAHDTYIALASGSDLAAMLAHLDDHMRQGLERTLSFIGFP